MQGDGARGTLPKDRELGVDFRRRGNKEQTSQREEVRGTLPRKIEFGVH